MAPTCCHTGGCEAREQIISKAQGFSCRAKRGARPEHQYRCRITADHPKITVGTSLLRTQNQQTELAVPLECPKSVWRMSPMDKARRKHTWAMSWSRDPLQEWEPGLSHCLPGAITAQRGRVASLQTLQTGPPSRGGLQKIWKPGKTGISCPCCMSSC